MPKPLLERLQFEGSVYDADLRMEAVDHIVDLTLDARDLAQALQDIIDQDSWLLADAQATAKSALRRHQRRQEDRKVKT